jgi:hypothetical protein
VGIERPGREADHPPPSSAEIKNAWSLIKHRKHRGTYLRTGTALLCTFSWMYTVGIALGYGLDERGSIPVGCWEFF